LRKEEFTKWIDKIYATKENELDCEQTQTSLPAYVDAEFSGTPLPNQADAIESHLNQCPDCMESYQGLHHVLAVEAAHETPEPEPDNTEPLPASTVADITKATSELSAVTTS
jgi:predicted anti-sigma-YlaC factor YlaD